MTTTDQPTLSRRDRKRLQTRTALVHAAIEHFHAKGFDETTVADIAEAADVDPSTFFRHFGTKEAVLFTDMELYVAQVERLLAEEPPDAEGSLLDQLRATTLACGREEGIDPELNLLRISLQASSPQLHAQWSVYRDRLVAAMELLVGRLTGLRPEDDPLPHLVATIWFSAYEWYRQTAIAGGRPFTDEAQVLEMVMADVTRVCQRLLD